MPPRSRRRPAARATGRSPPSRRPPRRRPRPPIYSRRRSSSRTGSSSPRRCARASANVRDLATVLVDAENVRRSIWPNIGRDRLVELCEAWGETNGHRVIVVFEGDATADDWIAEHAAEHRPYWLVTSDRGLRARAGGGAERVMGGGSFARELRGDPRH